MISDQWRKKLFFTSNLGKPLKDTEIDRLARSDIQHLNVSMDSVYSDLFSALRKGGRFHIFHDNLKLLSRALKESDHAPELRFITMAYKSTRSEIPVMIEKSFGKWVASRHEIRRSEEHTSEL